MLYKFFSPLVLVAALAAAPAVQAQEPGNIVITAPRNLTIENGRAWDKLRNENAKLVKQIADRDKRIARERANATKQQRRVADAQKKLAREQSRLEKNERNLSREMSRRQSAQQDLAKVRDSMIEMGGVRAQTMPSPR